MSDARAGSHQRSHEALKQESFLPATYNEITQTLAISGAVTGL